MSNSKRIYVLTGQIKNKILSASTITLKKRIEGRVFLIRGRLRSIHCKRCNREIVIGETVFSSRAKRKQNLYHFNCAISVNLI